MNRERAEEIMSALALSFNGYGYATRRAGKELPGTRSQGGDAAPALPAFDLESLVEAFLQTGRLSEREEENWAIYFMLQRMLCKGGSGFFTPRDRDTKAAALCFLHLYTRDIPSEYICVDYIGYWTRIPVEEREAAARFVRKWLKGGSQKDSAADVN